MIQWYPGHMAKAMNKIKELSKVIDIFIVILDARAPLSSYNEDFDAIASHKPRLFVITKQDFGDQLKLNKITNNFNHKLDEVIIVNLKNKSAYKKIVSKVKMILEFKKLANKKKGFVNSSLRAMVVGVPNSGKSTLVNVIAKGRKTKVANIPGVTRAHQWISTKEFQLLDTPGILWPKFDDPLTGIKLAIIGSIKTEIIPLQELSYAGYKLLSKYYPSKMQELGLKSTFDENEIYSELYQLAERKKFFKKNNFVDLSRVMTFFIHYLKNMKGVTYD